MRLSRCFALLLLVPVPLAAQRADPAASAPLPGIVLDHATDQPVVGAIVSIDELRLRAVTDSAGRFTFPALPAGVHSFTTKRLGYSDLTETSEVGAGKLLIVRMVPQPIVLERVEVLGRRFETRRKASGFATFASDQTQLATSTAPTIRDFLEDRHQLRPFPCPGARGAGADCMIVRGRPMQFGIYLDDMRLTGGATLLDLYRPEEMYRVEVFPGLGQVRLYTPHYIKWMAKNGSPLPPVCIVCGA